MHHPVYKGACGRQKRVSDFLELELGMFVCLSVGTGFLVKEFRGKIERNYKEEWQGTLECQK